MERSIIFRAFADNPIVLRDLRATMRGTRAFWFQAAYLGLLGILAVTGYAMSTNQSLFDGVRDTHYAPRTFSIVDAQSQLQAFYYFIFMTLAALITLIAPALTATSVSDERQRQSLDLLVTTPLSATEMLVGKLMSSLAFLGVLLALSLPASALCVLLGGATLGDMFRVYALLAVDAVVLASIGLYFSCACKNSLHSVIWTYVSVIAFVVITFYAGFMTGIENGNPTSVHGIKPIVAIGLLSPFAVIFPAAGQSFALGPIAVPVGIAMLPFAFVSVRLLLTAAAYRFGTFGAESGRSLRKQLLGATGVVMLMLGYSMVAKGNLFSLFQSDLENSGIETIRVMWSVLWSLIAIALPFLPGLFVPVKAEDAPPGDAQTTQIGRDNGYFNPVTMLLPRHSGALPYFYTWLSVAVIGLTAGVVLSDSSHAAMTTLATLIGTIYVAGVGTLAWGLSRLAAQFIRAASSARALAFGLFILFNALPALPLTLMNWNEITKPVAFTAWLGGPFFFAPDNQMVVLSIIISGLVSVIVGLLIGMVSKPQKS